METEEKNEAQKWHFWFIVAFSSFLIVTFVYYLPLRFLYMSMSDEEHMMGSDMMENMSVGGDAQGGHGVSVVHEEEDILEGLAVNFIAKPTPVNVGATTTFSFFVNQKPGNVPVTVSELEIEHTKYMHVIGVRSDMNEFFHIHPDTGTTTLFGIDHTFNKPGRYKIWSEIKKDTVAHTFAHPSFEVEGEGVREEKDVSFGRNVITSGYQVALSVDDPVVKNKEVSLLFDIHTLTGKEVDVEPYLGADMHLVVIKDDWSEFVHTHPGGHNDSMMSDDHALLHLIPEARAHGGEEESAGAMPSGMHDEAIEFHTTLPSAGLYKVFAQFRPTGIDLPPDEALVAEFWIEVKDEASFPVSPWWMLLVISIIAIVVLSKLVNKYVREE